MTGPRRQLRRLGPPTTILVGLIVIWEFVARLFAVPAWLLPAPSAIVLALVDSAPALSGHLVTTLVEAALGFALALVAAFGTAILIDQSSLARRAIGPLLVASQTVPYFALAPLLAVWFGFGMLPKILIVALVGFFPIAVNLAAGLRAADPEVLDLLCGMGAGRRQIFTKVKLPGALPSLLAGMRIAATYSIIGAVIAEWIGASRGLGLFLLRAANSFKTDQVFAAIALIVLLSVVLYLSVDVLGRVIAPWTYANQEEPT